ncbi:MAG: class I SAM-dependent methyltransferase [Pirellulales bacterium]
MIPSHEIADASWLATSAGLEGLRLLSELPFGNHAAVDKGMKKLRRDYTQEQWTFLLDQMDLRKRAASKYALASQLLFTRRSLEQSTDDRIAAWKARHFFPTGVVADLCCGAGGDLALLALRGDACGVDLDPLLCKFAEHNTSVYADAARQRNLTPGKVTILQQNAEAFPLSPENFVGWHIDPDRRVTGARTTNMEYQEPSREALEVLLKKHPSALFKLAPATEPPTEWFSQCERIHIASRGECRQLLLAFGDLAKHKGLRKAVVITRDNDPFSASVNAVTLTEDATAEQSPLSLAESVSEFLYEPSAAVLAAQLSRSLCHSLGLTALAERVAYFTSSELLTSELVTGFRVRDVLPLDRKKLKAYLRERGIADLEIKKRGCDVEPEKLRKELKVAGDQRAVLLIASFAGRVQAIIADRLPS